MNIGWIKCRKSDAAGQWAKPYVTMNKDGYIVMSRKTFQTLKEPLAVHLFYDPANSRIGIKPADPASRDAFAVAKQGRHGGRLIRAFQFMQDFGIDLPQTIKFRDVRIDKDGVLILDLRTATVIQKKANRQRLA
jgi:hypothetical protein